MDDVVGEHRVVGALGGRGRRVPHLDGGPVGDARRCDRLGHTVLESRGIDERRVQLGVACHDGEGELGGQTAEVEGLRRAGEVDEPAELLRVQAVVRHDAGHECAPPRVVHLEVAGLGRVDRVRELQPVRVADLVEEREERSEVDHRVLPREVGGGVGRQGVAPLRPDEETLRGEGVGEQPGDTLAHPAALGDRRGGVRARSDGGEQPDTAGLEELLRGHVAGGDVEDAGGVRSGGVGHGGCLSVCLQTWEIKDRRTPGVGPAGQSARNPRTASRNAAVCSAAR